MAELKLKGEYVGPGEQKTAEHLRDYLPDSWVVYSGRKLAGAHRDDVDLIVVGERLIFVLEEKSWGPRIVTDDNHWYVGSDPRPNPLNRIGQLARKIAGLLKEHARGYKDIRGQRVLPGVILSHDSVEIFSGRNHDRSENIWHLAAVAQTLIDIDNDERTPLGPPRAAVLAYLDDMPARAGTFSMGGFAVVGRLDVPGVELAFQAQSNDGQNVVLKCYPIDELEQQGDPREFLRRETHAINRLAEINRTWRALPYFEDGVQHLFVVPVIPPSQARSLEAARRGPSPERVDGVLDNDVARRVVIDAFTALSEVHEFGLVHRALHPRRIWLGRAMRVMFSDFHLARISGAQTIALWASDGDISEDYRAPECAVNVGVAEPASDVFSLALSLCTWLLGSDAVELNAAELSEVVLAKFAWAGPMLAALAGAPGARPTAEQIVADLTPSEPAVPVAMPAEPEEFAPGVVVDGRYDIKNMLGRGGFATSWLVYDRQADHRKVLKQFRHGIPAELRSEYRAADSLRHDRCGRVYDVQLDNEPHYLVSEYVEGDSLEVRGTDRDVDEIKSIAAGVLEALAYIHGKGLVHGDVTPANVIVSGDGSECKLIDFGLAVTSGARPSGWNPRFAAPEVIAREPTVAASDIFGCAATLAYAMLGRPISKLVGGELEIVAPTDEELTSWGDAGAALLGAILVGTATNPAERPQSAEEFQRIIVSAAAPARNEQTDNPPLQPPADLAPRINPNVQAIRRLYRASSSGNAGNRGLDDEFAKQTYVPTLLDTSLLPRVINGELDVVLLSGNPGDGKTSVLVQLGDRLRQLGATEEHVDAAGWRLRLNGRLFVAVFDASESHGELSSDDLVHHALAPVVDGESATALIAVNDGRLLQFFTDHEGDYEEWAFSVQDQLEGKDRSDSRLALVDLKKRSLARLDDEDGLAAQVLAVLTDETLWNECSGCSAQSRCPIFANRNLLDSTGSRAFSELMLISHLRRRRRATFRDVRSAAAWLLTGDRSCDDIHAWEEQGRSSKYLDRAFTSELAFDTESNDYLIDEWADLDPAIVAAPTVDSQRRLIGVTRAGAASVARTLYFGPLSEQDEDVSATDVRAYRYLEEFVSMLRDPDNQRVRTRLLLGISRLVGAFGYTKDGLAMSGGMPGSPWAVLHTVPSSEFEVTVEISHQPYIEAMPDQLILRHASKANLPLTLDTAEIILRAADGEIINDASSDAIRQEIDSFIGQVGRQPSKVAHIVDSSGSVAQAAIEGHRITLKEGI